MNKLVVVAALLLPLAAVSLPVTAFAQAANAESNALSKEDAKALRKTRKRETTGCPRPPHKAMSIQ